MQRTSHRPFFVSRLVDIQGICAIIIIYYLLYIIDSVKPVKHVTT